MIARYEYTKRYLFTALESAPELFEHLLRGITDEEADRRPDPERFTLREVMAHLAEWDDIWRHRMQRICAENEPVLEGYDEGQLAIDHDYAHTDLVGQIRLFRERRAQMVAFLRSCAPAEWQRVGDRPEIGRITLEAQALLVPLHDTYHLRQAVQWRRRP